ncbi:hypothetical protein B0T18DRAFT_317844 [Schizothecium vesticola]|uniref:DUF1996 domain-containing protein n=1 Tax=Schizothecium vesticola TaxID=314040 RepID=A0AA40KAN9_9PEZI|nr:hypothetical protein B0T18DRAFT_317844 [Schizothecium vesticola]
MKASTSLAILGAAINGADAFFRMPCRGMLGIARLDPLVNPGEIAHHAHNIHGSNGFSESATYEDLINGDCTSCGVAQDKSVYWAPTLYFQHESGEFEEVQQVGGMLNYYFYNLDAKNPSSGLKAFPAGFRMIAGDANRRNFSVNGYDAKAPEPGKALWASMGQTKQEDLAQRAIGFNCMNYNGRDAEPSLYRHYMPDKSYLDRECQQGLRLEIMFPSCWNGKDLDSPNHRSHMAYPDEVMTGGCPAGFPVKFPGLFYETIWDTFAFVSKPGRFVLSNGDVDGYGYHADFMTGWKEEFLQLVLNECTSDIGNLEQCPHFTKIDDDVQRQCAMKRVPSLLANEKVLGTIGKTLPGGVQIHTGPEPANAANPIPHTNTLTAPSVGYSAGASPTYSNPLPGQVFHQSEEVAGPVAAAAITPAPEPQVDDGFEVIRTDYVTEGNMVNMVIVKEKIEYVTVTTTTYTSTATAANVKPRYEAHMKRHGRRHGHH